MGIHDNIPTYVHGMSHENRLKWHRRRVEIELPVFDLLDGIKSEFTNEEVREQLERVRRQRIKVENKIKVLECPDFITTRMRLFYHLTMLASSNINRLFHLLRAKVEQRKLIKICEQLKVDPQPYIRIEVGYVGNYVLDQTFSSKDSDNI